MKNRPRRSISKVLTISMLLLIGILGLEIVLLRYSTARPSSEISASTAFPPPLFPKTNSSTVGTALSNSSLELIAAINTTTIEPGQGIDIDYYLANPTDQNITMNSSSQFFAPGMYAGFCQPAIQSALYSGFFAKSNVSRATPIPLIPKVHAVTGCAGEQSYTFLAHSREMQAGAYYIFEPVSGYVANETNCLDYNGTTVYATESWCWRTQPFAAGIYTLAVGDDWGDLVFLYLTVL